MNVLAASTWNVFSLCVEMRSIEMGLLARLAAPASHHLREDNPQGST